METTIVHWGYIGIVEKEMETPIYIGVYRGIYWDDGKDNGNCYSIFGIYWNSGKGNGNYYSI